MKRIFAMFLTLVMTVSGLAGCEAARPEEGKDASLPIQSTESEGEAVSTPEESAENTAGAETALYASGTDIVLPLTGFVWSETLREGEDGKMQGTCADGLGIYEFLPAEDELATVALPILYAENGKVTPLLPKNAALVSVALLEQPRRGYEPVSSSWEEIEALSPGRYHVVTRVEYTRDANTTTCYEDLFTLVIGEESPKDGGQVSLLRFSPDGWGFSSKEIGGYAVAAQFLEALHALRPTGEVCPALSEEEMDPYGEVPAEPGTFWVEAEGKLYRAGGDYDSICLVDTHYGEGQALQMTQAFASLLSAAWYYAPYDFYKGTYKNGESSVELTNVYAAPSTVYMTVKELSVEKEANGENNKVVLELVSAVDQTLNLGYSSYASDDNRGSDGGETVELQAGVPATVECSFYGFAFRYWVSIHAGNTKIEIQIDP